MPQSTTLICTVGGSHAPIMTAISALQPAHVYFICSDTDPGTGRAGSSVQITGAGNCIKAHPADEKPTLPNIPAQAGLSAGQFTVLLTSADDLDVIYSVCRHAIAEALRAFPDNRLLADYTGGTKSMTAGLVVSALENPAVELHLITGNRADLIKVKDGYQSPHFANIESLRFERDIEPFIKSWQRYAYSEAEAGLSKVAVPRSPELRSRLNQLRDLSRAYAEWDNFNHAQALDILQLYAPKLSTGQKQGLGQLLFISQDNPEKRQVGQLFDLYLNALRRAEQGRYDDAVARCYRLIEWSAQWLLEVNCGIKTANINPQDIPECVDITPNRDGLYQAGLYAAWQLIKHKTSGSASAWISQNEQYLLHHLQTRNLSILAHGFAPIQRADWQALQTWLADAFIPVLLSETQKYGIKQLPAQLPTQIG